jgi:hypothetical protein
MSKKYKWITLTLSVLLLVIAWVFRPYESPDLDKVDSALKSLVRPYKKIDTFHFKDGGSVGIKITGRNNKIFMACFPAYSLIGDNNYQRLFIGGTHHTDKQVKETSNEHTKLRILQILRERPGNKLYDDACIAKSSTRWSDYFNVIWKRYVLNKKNYAR